MVLTQNIATRRTSEEVAVVETVGSAAVPPEQPVKAAAARQADRMAAEMRLKRWFCFIYTSYLY